MLPIMIQSTTDTTVVEEWLKMSMIPYDFEQQQWTNIKLELKITKQREN